MIGPHIALHISALVLRLHNRQAWSDKVVFSPSPPVMYSRSTVDSASLTGRSVPYPNRVRSRCRGGRALDAGVQDVIEHERGGVQVRGGQHEDRFAETQLLGVRAGRHEARNCGVGDQEAVRDRVLHACGRLGQTLLLNERQYGAVLRGAGQCSVVRCWQACVHGLRCERMRRGSAGMAGFNWCIVLHCRGSLHTRTRSRQYQLRASRCWGTGLTMR